MLALRDKGREPEYRVRLYIGGNSVHSMVAVGLVKDVCDERLGESYVLEVIDLNQQLPLASRDRIVAVPTLLKQTPLPARLRGHRPGSRMCSGKRY